MIAEAPIAPTCFRVSQANTEPVAIVPPERRHYWRVDALFDGHLYPTTAYEGDDYNMMIRRVGEMMMSSTAERVLVYRDGEEYRRCDVR